jgi:DNA-directed RNA polymerase specialized sigma24 family protein
VREFALGARTPAGDTALYEVLMRRYNQRLFRIARSVVRDDDEAEDVTQDTWVRAYASLHQFAGKAKFSTWLSKIAVHEASVVCGSTDGSSTSLQIPFESLQIWIS